MFVTRDKKLQTLRWPIFRGDPFWLPVTKKIPVCTGRVKKINYYICLILRKLYKS